MPVQCVRCAVGIRCALSDSDSIIHSADSQCLLSFERNVFIDKQKISYSEHACSPAICNWTPHPPLIENLRSAFVQNASVRPNTHTRAELIFNLDVFGTQGPISSCLDDLLPHIFSGFAVIFTPHGTVSIFKNTYVRIRQGWVFVRGESGSNIRIRMVTRSVPMH